MSKILISGASGYIGRFLFNYLKEMGHEVYGLLRDPKRKVFYPMNMRTLFINEAKKSLNWDGVVHLAFGLSEILKQSIKENVKLTKELMEIAMISKAKYVYTSSIAVVGYCNSVKDSAFKELRSISTEDAYTKIKGYLETFIAEYSKKTDIDNSIIRVGNVMGPGSAWTSLLLDQVYNIKRDLNKKAFSNATSIFNLIRLIGNTIILKQKKERIILSTEFSNYTWGDWIENIFKHKNGYLDINILKEISEHKNKTFRISKYINMISKTDLGRLLKSYLPRKVLKKMQYRFKLPMYILPEHIYEESDSVIRLVFNCNYQWPTYGYKDITFEETCRVIRDWAIDSGYRFL